MLDKNCPEFVDLDVSLHMLISYRPEVVIGELLQIKYLQTEVPNKQTLGKERLPVTYFTLTTTFHSRTLGNTIESYQNYGTNTQKHLAWNYSHLIGKKQLQR